MIELTEAPLDHAQLTEKVRSNRAGAVCTFLGTVREMTGDRRTESLEYEAYPEMVLKKLAELEAEVRELEEKVAALGPPNGEGRRW